MKSIYYWMEEERPREDDGVEIVEDPYGSDAATSGHGFPLFKLRLGCWERKLSYRVRESETRILRNYSEEAVIW